MTNSNKTSWEAEFAKYFADIAVDIDDANRDVFGPEAPRLKAFITKAVEEAKTKGIEECIALLSKNPHRNSLPPELEAGWDDALEKLKSLLNPSE